MRHELLVANAYDVLGLLPSDPDEAQAIIEAARGTRSLDDLPEVWQRTTVGYVKSRFVRKRRADVLAILALVEYIVRTVSETYLPSLPLHRRAVRR